MTDSRNRLADPDYAAFAWGRYRRLMVWMALVVATTAVLAVLWLWATGTIITVTLIVATLAGVGFTVLLGTALMGLVFLSSGTGHDADVHDVKKDM